MGYWGGVWSSLKYSIGDTTDSLFRNNLRYRYISREDEGPLVYVNNRDGRPIAVRYLVQTGYQMVEEVLHKALPRYQKHIEKKLRENALKNADSNQKLIENRLSTSNKLGAIKLDNGTILNAVDAYGYKVSDALFVYYETDQEREVTIYERADLIRGEKESELKETKVKTKTLYFCDLSPEINQSTSKNILLTKVQGRDCTRKELISGGDVHFTVKGSINSNKDGEYPENDVKKFIQIMQHNGIIKVNHLLFRQFNVTNIIIQDFKLEAQTYKNIQPYSFTCVAVEPDEDVVVSTDTINIINTVIVEDGASKWEKLILGYKLSEITDKNPEFDKVTTLIPDILANLI